MIEMTYKFPNSSANPIAKLMIAFESTFVFLSFPHHQKIGNEKGGIYHVHKDGNVISRFQFHEYFKTFFMVSQEEIVVPLQKSKIIRIINIKLSSLRGQITFKDISFDFQHRKNPIMKECSNQYFYFSQTKLLCIAQRISVFKNYSLTYISLCNSSVFGERDRLCAEQKSIQGHTLQEIMKGNHHSLIIILFRILNSPSYKIELYDLEDKGVMMTHRYRTLVFEDTFYKPKPVFWEVERDIFAVSINHKSRKWTNSDTNLYMFYIGDNKSMEFDLLKQYFISESDDFQIFPGFVLIHQKYNKTYERKLVPCIIRNISSEISPISIVMDPLVQNVSTCDYIQDLFMVTNFKNNREIAVRLLWDIKDVYMQFLLKINEDFDDDLLMDVIQLLKI